MNQLGFYQTLIESAEKYNLSLYQSLEKYRLARLGALFSRLRQQNFIFSLFKLAFCNSEQSKKLVVKYDYSVQQDLIKQKVNFQIKQIVWNSLIQFIIDKKQNEILKMQQQQKQYKLLRNKNKMMFMKLVFTSMLDHFKLTQNKEQYNKSKCKKHQATIIALNLKNTFTLWKLALNQHQFREARVTAFFLRQQKELKEKAFNTLYKKFYKLRKKLYKNTNQTLSTLHDQKIMIETFQAFRYKMEINLKKERIICQISIHRIQFSTLICLKQAYKKQQQYTQFIYFQQENLLRKAFLAIISARESPFQLEKLQSFTSICNYRKQIIAINAWRKLSQQQIKYRISRIQNNRFLIKRAFSEIREAAKVLNSARKFAEPWHKKRGVFRFQEGRTWEVVGFFINHMRVKAGLNEVVLVEKREDLKLGEVISAWIDYIQRNRVISVILNGKRNLIDKVLIQKCFKALVGQHQKNISEIQIYGNQLKFLQLKSFKYWRQAYQLQQWALKMKKWLHEALIKNVFSLWKQLRPYAQILQRILVELDILGIKIDPSELQNMTIQDQINYLLEEYGENLDESILNFIKLGLDILEDENQLSRSQINKYNRKLFLLKDFDKIGNIYYQVQEIQREFLLEKAYIQLKKAYIQNIHQNRNIQHFYESNLKGKAFSSLFKIQAISSNIRQAHYQNLKELTFKQLRQINIFLQKVVLSGQLYKNMLMRIGLVNLSTVVSVQNIKRINQLNANIFYQKTSISKYFQLWLKLTLLQIKESHLVQKYQNNVISKIFNLLLEQNRKQDKNWEIFDQYNQQNNRKLKLKILNQLQSQFSILQKKKENHAKQQEFQNNQVHKVLHIWIQKFNIKMKYKQQTLASNNFILKKFLKLIIISFQNQKFIQKLYSIADNKYEQKLRCYLFKWMSITQNHQKYSFLFKKAKVYEKQNTLLKCFNLMRIQKIQQITNKQHDNQASIYHKNLLIKISSLNIIKCAHQNFISQQFYENFLLRISFYKLQINYSIQNKVSNQVKEKNTMHLQEIFYNWRSKIKQSQLKLEAAVKVSEMQNLLSIFKLLREKSLYLQNIYQYLVNKKAEYSLKTIFIEWLGQLANKLQIEDEFVYQILLKKNFKVWLKYCQQVRHNISFLTYKSNISCQKSLFSNLRILLTKFQLNNQLADSHFKGIIERKVYLCLQDELMKLKFYNKDPKQKLKKAIQSWKKISRDNALVRHKEVKAERYHRKGVVTKIFIEWAAICGVELGWQDF